MNPAFSVLIFTVASGAGYGLMSLLILAQLLGLIDVKHDLIIPAGTALGLITLGLCSSTLHLANPKNAWRAFSCFRTSWLSREGVFAVLYYPLALSYLGGIWVSGSVTPWLLVLGIATVALGLAILFCTGMIYASLKTIPQWNLALTPINYILLGLMSGAALLLAMAERQSTALSNLCIVLVCVAGLGKVVYFFWIGSPSGSTIKTATTFTQSRVRLLDQGHTADGFLNKEFIFNLDAGQLFKLRLLAVALVFVVPLAFTGLFLQAGFGALAWASVIVMLAGLLLERWLFFAEARHVVRLYHGDQVV